MPFAKDEQVGPYRIVSKLGQGGMATVYKAYHEALDRHVAIKVMHESFKEDSEFIARFQREARIVARLEHTNIIPIYDFSEYEGNPYLVMKFVEGVTLKERIKERMLTLKETIQLLDGVGAGLTYAHNRGILHRDIKPSNVMLDAESTPYIADFGLARIVSAGESTLSQDTMLGTPQYMSPEQARGDKILTPGTDIYSLGVMLFELVVGRVPFNADTPYTVVHDHIFTPLPMPSSINPEVPPSVELVLIKALEKEVKDRYASVEALVEAFKQAVIETGLEDLPSGLVKKLPQDEPSLAAESTAIDEFEDIPAETPLPQGKPTADPAETPALERHAAPMAAPEPPPAFEPAIPPVIVPTAEDIAALRTSMSRKRGRNASAWIMGGCGVLIFCCLLFTSGLLSVFSADIPGSGPPSTLKPVSKEIPELANFDIPEEPEALGEALADAQEAAEINPYDPVAQFNLALLTLLSAPDAPNPMLLSDFVQAAAGQPELLLAGVEKLIEFEFDLYAAALAVRALELYPDRPTLRETVGAYLWQFSAESGEMLWDFYEEIETRITNPVVQTAYARALIEGETPAYYEKAQDQLDLAFEANSSLGEAYLTLGVLYAVKGQPDQALRELGLAKTAPDRTVWVEEKAEELIRQYKLRSATLSPSPESHNLELTTIPAIELPEDPEAFADLLEDAQIAVEANPDDPVAQFALLSLTLKINPQAADEAGVFLPFIETIEDDPALLVEAGEKLTEYDLTQYAGWLAIQSLEHYPDSQAIREKAGAYLWVFAKEFSSATLNYYRYFGDDVENPLNRVWYARALAAKGNLIRLRRANQQISLALEESDDSLAEAYLALGLFAIAEERESEVALALLESAIDAPDSPEWVQTLAQTTIRENGLRDK